MGQVTKICCWGITASGRVGSVVTVRELCSAATCYAGSTGRVRSGGVIFLSKILDMKIEEKSPAEIFMTWIRLSGPGQAILRWLALVPSIAVIVLFSQVIFLSAASLISSGNQILSSWLMNMLNAAFMPFLIVRYGTPIAPSFRRGISIVLAIIAVCLVVLSRLAFELSHPSDSSTRYVWLAISALVCLASAAHAVRDVNRKI